MRRIGFRRSSAVRGIRPDQVAEVFGLAMLRRYTRLSGSCQHWGLGLSMAAVFQSQPLPWRASGFTLQARHFFFGLGNRGISADARVDGALSACPLALP